MSNKTNLVQRPLLRYGCFQRLRHSSSSLTIIREADDCPRNMLHTLPQTKGVELCRLKHHYDSILRYDLMQKLIIQNTHQTPKLEKIILSSSVSYKPQQVRGLENIAAKNSGDGVGKGALETLTPQVKKALILLSGQSLSAKTFRVARPHLGIRKGKLAAYQVTLRNEGMYFFIERLLTEILPKVIRIDKAVLTSGSNSSNRHLHKNLLKLANFELLVDEDGSPAKKAA
jgi:ribosomal protein L5|eukprot:COSAG04_NODE_1391_length_6956_cov_3.379029_3_plen_229_part_00